MSALTVRGAAVLSLAATGCGKYSWGALSAQKAYKDANALYPGSDWKGAAAKYESALASDPSRIEIYFYLGTATTTCSRPATGEAENDRYIQKAIENYEKSGREGLQAGDEEAGAPVPRRGATVRRN
jgi:hypothetical protein